MDSLYSRRLFLKSVGVGVVTGGLPTFAPGQIFRPQGGRVLIKGGTVVTVESISRIDIRIQDGKIRELGANLTERPSETLINVPERHILPGAIDPHVHLSKPWVDNFTSGSEAAITGGITTVGHMTQVRRLESLVDAVTRESERVAKESIVDVIFHPILGNPDKASPGALQALVDAGQTSIKIFMIGRNFDSRYEEFFELVKRAGEMGILCLIHCEDSRLLREASEFLKSQGRTTIRDYADARPDEAEAVATRRAVRMGKLADVPIYLVHLSSKSALDICNDARGHGTTVYAETRPMYLHLTRERFDGPQAQLYTGMPPLRTGDDVKALWEGIANGSIHTLGTDHAPWTLEQKLEAGLNIDNFKAGAANLQLMIPMFVSEGYHQRGLSLQRIVEVTATNPAKLFGLYPQKGTIKVGSDADLAIWDLNERRTVKREDLKSKAGFSLYEGMEITGWPTTTVRRGEIVYQNGLVIGLAGSGQLLNRGPTQTL